MEKKYKTTINCPACQTDSEFDSIFNIRIGDCLMCSCGAKLVIKQIGPTSQVEEIKPPKFSALKEKNNK